MITRMLKCDACGFLWPLPTSPEDGIQPGALHVACEQAGAFRFANVRPMASPLLQAAMKDFEAAENLAATLEEQLKEAKANAKYIGETVLKSLVEPDDFNHGVRLPDGSEWVFEQKLKCNVPDGAKREAYEYLEEKKAGGLLRRYITLSFGKDSTEQVKQVRTMLARVLPQFEIGVKVGRAPESLRAAVAAILTEAGLNIEVTESVELPGPTMASFVRKEMAAGREVPPAFSVYAPLRPIPAHPTPLTPEEDARQSAELIAKLQLSLLGSGGDGGMGSTLPSSIEAVSNVSGGSGGSAHLAT